MDRHMGICHPRLEVTIRSSICVASRWSFPSHDLVLTDEGIRSPSLRGTFIERFTFIERRMILCHSRGLMLRNFKEIPNGRNIRRKPVSTRCTILSLNLFCQDCTCLLAVGVPNLETLIN